MAYKTSRRHSVLNHTEKACANEDRFRAFRQGCFHAAAYKDIHQEIRKALLIGMWDFKLKSSVSERPGFHRHRPNEKWKQCVWKAALQLWALPNLFFSSSESLTLAVQPVSHRNQCKVHCQICWESDQVQKSTLHLSKCCTNIN